MLGEVGFAGLRPLGDRARGERQEGGAHAATCALGNALVQALSKGSAGAWLDLGCVAAHGHFARRGNDGYDLVSEGRPATAFLFELIARLQNTATVPMIDIRAYAKWLIDPM